MKLKNLAAALSLPHRCVSARPAKVNRLILCSYDDVDNDGMMMRIGPDDRNIFTFSVSSIICFFHILWKLKLQMQCPFTWEHGCV